MAQTIYGEIKTSEANANKTCRAWLYQLLSELELWEILEANRTEKSGCEVTINIKWK